MNRDLKTVRDYCKMVLDDINMENNEMNLDKGYFDDEVIDGFYVPTMMKRCWGAHLVILEDVERICKKHNITYFADWGTLLGCVRNGGVVPWDDDFDICMKREDYNKFLKVWKEELGDKYYLACLQTDVNRQDFMAKLSNMSQFVGDFSKIENFANFPYGVGIDIFILDYIAPTEEEDIRLCQLYNDAGILAYKYKNNLISKEDFRKELYEIEKKSKIKIDKNKDIYNELNLLAEEVYSCIPEEKANEITQMHIYSDKRKYRIPKWCYSDVIYMSFEGINMPVPIGYEEILKRKYGNYINPVRRGGSHGYPFYEDQAEWVYKKTGVRIGTFQAKNIDKEGINRTDIKEELQSTVTELKNIHKLIKCKVEENNENFEEFVFSALEGCQKIAISVGTIIESNFGEDCPIVKNVEDYCELLYQMSVKCSLNILKELDDSVDLICQKIGELKRNVMKAVVIPYKEKYFYQLKGLISEYKEKGVEVSILPIPYYTKNFEGKATSEVIEEEFWNRLKKEGYDVKNYKEYDMVSERPNEIIIQNPYDWTNYSTTVAPAFYSENLKKVCDELIYVSPFLGIKIDINDERTKKMIEDAINRPAVIYADKVYVDSEKIKEVYIESLKKFVGKEYENIWENRIYVYDFDIRNCKPGKKKLCYYVSFGEAVLFKEKLLDKINKSVQIIEEKGIDFNLMVDILINDNNEKLGIILYNEINRIVSDNKFNANYVKAEDYGQIVKEYDAFYGDSGALSNMFRMANKPVMIENVDI